MAEHVKLERRSFITERCELNPALHIAQRALFDIYVQWCIENKQVQVNKRTFYRKVLSVKGVGHSQRRIEGKAQKTFEGLGVRDGDGVAMLASAERTLEKLNLAALVLELEQRVLALEQLHPELKEPMRADREHG